MAFDSSVLTLETDGPVATLWLDRPEKRNAFNLPFWEDIPTAMGELSDDDDIRVVIIAARGSAFTVGIDLIELGPELMAGSLDESGSTSDAARARATYDLVKQFQRTLTSIAECPKPVIAAIQGWCLGAGIDLISGCDIRLASEDAVFSVRETKMAMVADVGTLQRLPSIVAPGHLAELIYTGRDIDAARALEIGLVNATYPDHEALLKAARELADEIAENSPLAVQGTKAVLRAGSDRSVEEALDYVALWNAAFLRSGDLDEAVQAFLEKRRPEFRGQ
ncbi:MAG: crotonase/enoyl-CoA hydratase family protein [Acidimicrobiia bacterium]